MGTYVNPRNMGFQRARRGEYVDKSRLISLVNGAIGGPQNLICVSRPRRFGKSYAAEMLCSYYSCGCDSRALFEDLAIARVPSFEEHLDDDMREVNDADDVFAVLAHLGYVAYDEGSQTVRVPNEEVRLEFVSSLERGRHPEVRRLVEAADATLAATLAEDAHAVAASVGAAHDSRVGPDWHNDEQSLRFAVKPAYLTAIERYAEVEELPSGHGYADLVYLPRRYACIPALVVELRWNKPVDSALDQIRDRNYPKALEEYGGPLLLVGITYDAKTKEHTATIERMSKQG